MDKILYISQLSMDIGGAESIIYKIYKECKKRDIIIDFAVFSNEKCTRDDELISMGSKIFYLGYISILRHPFSRLMSVYKCVKKGEYTKVMFATLYPHYTLCLLAAKLAGATTLILRSTNAGTESYFLGILNRYDKILSRMFSNVRFAPSELAADYLFGKNSLKKYNVNLLYNGIDTTSLRYNGDVRKNMRKELSLNDKFVVGHIGRLVIQKNHKFLLSVFKEIYDLRKNSVLVLVGKGDLKKEIEIQATELGINENVMFLGFRNDAFKCMMAMDVMIFPSLFEGMPNAVIEAQTTGLPCLVADTITKECQVTDRVEFLSLNETFDKWAKKALDMVSTDIDRSLYADRMREAGYDIKDVAQKFIDIVGLNK